MVVGVPTLRLKGDYLAIATLGVSEIIRIAIINGGDFTNGAAGLTGILPFTNWSLVFFFVVGIAILLLNFLRSSFGRQVIAVRENEIAAESMGVNTTQVKVTVFVIAAIVSSIAGSLYVGYIGTVVPKDFTIMRSIDYLIIAVLGGLGSMTGTILAAIILGAALGGFIIGLLETLAITIGLSSYRDAVVYGILIVILLVRPAGILGKNVKEKV